MNILTTLKLNKFISVKPDLSTMLVFFNYPSAVTHILHVTIGTKTKWALVPEIAVCVKRRQRSFFNNNI